MGGPEERGLKMVNPFPKEEREYKSLRRLNAQGSGDGVNKNSEFRSRNCSEECFPRCPGDAGVGRTGPGLGG